MKHVCSDEGVRQNIVFFSSSMLHQTVPYVFLFLLCSSSIITAHINGINGNHDDTRLETGNRKESKILHEDELQYQAESDDWDTYTRVKMAEKNQFGFFQRFRQRMEGSSSRAIRRSNKKQKEGGGSERKRDTRRGVTTLALNIVPLFKSTKLPPFNLGTHVPASIQR